MMLRKEHLWNFCVLQRVHLSNLVGDAADSSLKISAASLFPAARKLVTAAKEISSGLPDYSNCCTFLFLLLLLHSVKSFTGRPACRLWNVGKRLPDCTALQLRKQPSSYSPPWEPQILLFHIVVY
jgi:hypothetical protein